MTDPTDTGAKGDRPVPARSARLTERRRGRGVRVGGAAGERAAAQFAGAARKAGHLAKTRTTAGPGDPGVGRDDVDSPPTTKSAGPRTATGAAAGSVRGVAGRARSTAGGAAHTAGSTLRATAETTGSAVRDVAGTVGTQVRGAVGAAGSIVRTGVGVALSLAISKALILLALIKRLVLQLLEALARIVDRIRERYGLETPEVAETGRPPSREDRADEDGGEGRRSTKRPGSD